MFFLDHFTRLRERLISSVMQRHKMDTTTTAYFDFLTITKGKPLILMPLDDLEHPTQPLFRWEFSNTSGTMAIGIASQTRSMQKSHLRCN
jgi:hypothetical protein